MAFRVALSFFNNADLPACNVSMTPLGAAKTVSILRWLVLSITYGAEKLSMRTDFKFGEALAIF